MAGIARQCIGQVRNRHIVSADDHAALRCLYQLGNVFVVLALDCAAFLGHVLDAHVILAARHQEVPGAKVIGIAEHVGLDFAGVRQLEAP